MLSYMDAGFSTLGVESCYALIPFGYVIYTVLIIRNRSLLIRKMSTRGAGFGFLKPARPVVMSVQRACRRCRTYCALFLSLGGCADICNEPDSAKGKADLFHTAC